MGNYIRRENNMNTVLNDSKIMTLKAQILEKRDKLDKSRKFIPVTNCSIEVNGIRSNIQVLMKEQLISLLVKLNSYKISAKELGLLDEFMISGYKIEDWIIDVKSRLDVVSRKDEERNLKIMEDRLSKLLSNEKKVELEIDEIANILKEDN